MRYVVPLLALLTLASCAPSVTSPPPTVKQPTAPRQPAVDFSKLPYDAPEWKNRPSLSCYSERLQMNYSVQIDSLRNRIGIFEYQKIPKSTAVMIHNSLVESYREIKESMNNEFKSLTNYGVFASSLCVSKMNLELTLRNASVRLLRDPIEIEYQQTINKSEIRYEYSMMVFNYLDFYSDMLSSAARELDKIAKVINSTVE